MLSLVSRDLRRAASIAGAIAIVSIGLVAVDRGHNGALRSTGVVIGAEPSVVVAPVTTLPEVEVVAQRLDY